MKGDPSPPPLFLIDGPAGNGLRGISPALAPHSSGARLHVLMVLHSHECGGAEMHGLQLMQGLKSLGHRITYAGPRDSWLMNQAKSAGLETLNVPLNGTYDGVSVAKLAVFARRFGVHLIHGHLTRGAFYAGWASRLSGVPALSTAHSTNTWRHFTKTRQTIAVSESVKASLLARTIPNLTPERISVVFNGVPSAPEMNESERQAMRKELNLTPETFAVAMVARFIRDKGHDIALDALERQKTPAVRLFFVGKAEGEWHNTVLAETRRRGLDGQVSFLGHRDDVRRLLPAMDALLMPSRREAIGLALLEALAGGVPVVASRVGGIPEVVEDGVNGLLVESEDAAGFAEGLRRLMTDPSLKSSLSAAGRETFRARFAQSAMVENTLRVYEQVLSQYAR